MYTFSQLVDAMVSECKRPDLRSEIARYLNQTIRELHFTPDRNAALFFEDNFNEVLLTADVESGFTWEMPRPTCFQHMAGVKYLEVFDMDNNGVWATLTIPGRHLNQLDTYFYRVGQTFVFSGYGGVDCTIAVGYFQFPPSLSYLASGTRPAIYTEEDGWTYADSVTTPEEELAARESTSNWLILRWNDVVSEGVRAKLYKRTADTERARTSYSLYGSLRQGLWTSEQSKFVGG